MLVIRDLNHSVSALIFLFWAHKWAGTNLGSINNLLKGQGKKNLGCLAAGWFREILMAWLRSKILPENIPFSCGLGNIHVGTQCLAISAGFPEKPSFTFTICWFARSYYLPERSNMVVRPQLWIAGNELDFTSSRVHCSETVSIV